MEETSSIVKPADRRRSPQPSSSGDRQKRRRFEELIVPHLDSAYNLARWLAGNDSDASDVTQEACLRAYKYLDSFEGDNPAGWLLAIVRNAYFSWTKQNHRSEEIPGTDALDAELLGGSIPVLFAGSRELTSDPETLLIDSRARALVNGLIARLPTEHREIIVLREIEELSYREIADVVGIPIGTVMSRLSRARGLLHESLLRSQARVRRNVSPSNVKVMRTS